MLHGIVENQQENVTEYNFVLYALSAFIFWTRKKY